MSDEVEASSVPEIETQPTSEVGTDRGVVRAQYAWSSTDPSTAVIETVAVAVDRDPTELDPLYDTLDPDALNAIIRSNANTASGSPVDVSFVFAEKQVTVRNTGEVAVQPLP